MRVVDIAFPTGTIINSAGAPQCKATDADFASKGDTACPASTRVDTGRASDNAAQAKLKSGAPIEVKVSAFNRKGGLLLYLRPSVGAPFVLRPAWTGKATKRHLVTTIKAITVPNDEVVLTKFKLSTKPKNIGIAEADQDSGQEVLPEDEAADVQRDADLLGRHQAEGHQPADVQPLTSY